MAFNLGMIFFCIWKIIIVTSTSAVPHSTFNALNALRNISENVDSTNRGLYSTWTKWSKCLRTNDDCEKRRFSICLSPEDHKKCPHGSVLIQSKSCRRSKRCKILTKAKNPMRLIDDLFDHSSVFDEFFFTTWSEWTDCFLKECKQYRWKICNFEPICGERLRVQQRICNEELHDMCLNYQTPVTPDPLSESDLQSDSDKELLTRASVTTSTINIPEVSLHRNLSSRGCGVAPLSLQPRRISTKIFAGKASKPGSWPWQVAILNANLEHYCAGTLISNWVLTAAHCVRRRMYILLGEHQMTKEEDTEQLYAPSKIILHRHFNTRTVENDIALLKIDQVSLGSHAHPICLPEWLDDSELLAETTKCMVIGWGKRKPYSRFGADILHEAQVEIIPQHRCVAAYYGTHPITGKMMCAGSGSGRLGNGDTCEGDSGGPLMCQTEEDGAWNVVGITSFGDSCGKRNKYGVYTRVSVFLPWIKNVIDHA